jgi:hypothetical protein
MVADITMPASGDTATSPVGSPANSSGQAEYILSFWVSTMWRGLIYLTFQPQSPPNTKRLLPMLNLSEHSAQLALQSSLDTIPVRISLVNRPIVPSNCKVKARFLLRCLMWMTIRYAVPIRMSESLTSEKFWTGFYEIRYWHLKGSMYPSQ